MWYSVRRGEKKNIFPYQEEADYMFNSSVIYEIAALKKHIVPLLEEIKDVDEKTSDIRQEIIAHIAYFQNI